MATWEKTLPEVGIQVATAAAEPAVLWVAAVVRLVGVGLAAAADLGIAAGEASEVRVAALRQHRRSDL